MNTLSNKQTIGGQTRSQVSSSAADIAFVEHTSYRSTIEPNQPVRANPSNGGQPPPAPNLNNIANVVVLQAADHNEQQQTHFKNNSSTTNTNMF